MKLPREAGRHDDMGFEPNDVWLGSAGEELQIEAMRQWFLDRYEDPVMETPWDSESKSYVFVWGGPYDQTTLSKSDSLAWSITQSWRN